MPASVKICILCGERYFVLHSKDKGRHCHMCKATSPIPVMERSTWPDTFKYWYGHHGRT